MGAACTFKPSLPKRRKEGEEDEEEEDEEEGDADRRAVEEFMGRYSEVRHCYCCWYWYCCYYYGCNCDCITTVTAAVAVATTLIHTYQHTPLTTPTHPPTPPTHSTHPPTHCDQDWEKRLETMPDRYISYARLKERLTEQGHAHLLARLAQMEDKYGRK